MFLSLNKKKTSTPSISPKSSPQNHPQKCHSTARSRKNTHKLITELVTLSRSLGDSEGFTGLISCAYAFSLNCCLSKMCRTPKMDQPTTLIILFNVLTLIFNVLSRDLLHVCYVYVYSVQKQKKNNENASIPGFVAGM